MAALGDIAVLTPPRPKLSRRRRKITDKISKRAREATARAEYDRLRAIDMENAAEEMAPAAQRLNAMAVPDTKTGGYRRFDPLLMMHRRSHGRTITVDHLKAARRLRDDYEVGPARAVSPKGTMERVDGARGGEAEFRWLDATRRFNEVMAALGASLRGVVEAVVIQWQTVVWIAEKIGQTEPITTGLIVAGLDRIADHYEPHRRTRAQRMEKALAEMRPQGFDFAIAADGVAIPQERMGIGRIRA